MTEHATHIQLAYSQKPHLFEPQIAPLTPHLGPGVWKYTTDGPCLPLRCFTIKVQQEFQSVVLQNDLF